MDIKAKVTEIVEKAAKDPAFKKELQENPEKAIEKIAGVDLPDGVVDQVVAGVKAKMSADKISDAAGFIKKLI